MAKTQPHKLALGRSLSTRLAKANVQDSAQLGQLAEKAGPAMAGPTIPVLVFAYGKRPH